MKKLLRATVEDSIFERMRLRFVALAPILTLMLGILSCSRDPEVLHSYRYVADGTSTVFQQLRTIHDVKADSSGMGVLVKSIDGVEQTRTAFWLFFVNNEAASGPASAIVPEAGDTVEWRLTAIY